jgi:hypothetical protein
MERKIIKHNKIGDRGLARSRDRLVLPEHEYVFLADSRRFRQPKITRR